MSALLFSYYNKKQKTHLSQAMVGLLSVFAELERDMIRERVKAGIAQAPAGASTGGRGLATADRERKLAKLRMAAGEVDDEKNESPVHATNRGSA
jgi:DNA invertase Pin-like site-specific DNA recombinase